MIEMIKTIKVSFKQSIVGPTPNFALLREERGGEQDGERGGERDGVRGGTISHPLHKNQPKFTFDYKANHKVFTNHFLVPSVFIRPFIFFFVILHQNDEAPLFRKYDIPGMEKFRMIKEA